VWSHFPGSKKKGCPYKTKYKYLEFWTDYAGRKNTIENIRGVMMTETSP
jgi:hypothetical protein